MNIYSDWLYSKYVLNKLQNKFTGKDAYEARNIMERYLISSYNGISNAEEKMKAEFAEKRLTFSPELLDRSNIPTDFEPLPIFDNNKLIVADFVTPATERMNFLITNFGLTVTANVYLRYESILAGSQHWGIPWPVADVLYQNNFVNEGFASPLNSRLIDKENGRYCSLFPTIDPNSAGSFFDVNLLDFPGNWSINPPMIESMIEALVDKVISALSVAAGKAYFISLSNWEDMPAYQRLKSSPYLKEMRILPKSKYYYHTPNKEVIVANFESVYFILADNRHSGFQKKFYDQVWHAWTDIKGGRSVLPARPATVTAPTATPLLIETYISRERRFHVINDAEKFQGGSKERALPVLVKLANQYGTLVYAGPKTGYAQIILSIAAQQAGKKAVLFLQSYDDHETSMTERARKLGAIINYRKEKIQDLEREAENYISKHGGYNIKFGLKETEICSVMANTMEKEIQITNFPVEVKRIWLVAGSCMLLQTLYKMFPKAIFVVIQVGMTIWPDLYNQANTVIFEHKLAFPVSTQILPPYDSIASYDAKVWEYVEKFGSEGDYIWNVGKE